MKNTFKIGAQYSASQKISRLALTQGYVPLYFQNMVYDGYEIVDGEIEHHFICNGRDLWFMDYGINNDNSEDNSITIG